jgi:predicted secreted protein
MICNSVKYPVCIILCIYLQSASADDNVLYNKVNLQASAVREVPNDQMTVILYSEHQGVDPAKTGDRVNRDMDWALEIIHDDKSIQSSTRSYQTIPVYKDSIITGWRVSQELALQGTDFDKLVARTGDLQSRLQIRQMFFNPTRATRTGIENELIEEALASFRKRAAIIQKQMDGMDYRIVELHIGTDENHFRPVMMQERASVAGMSAMQMPAVDAGNSTVTVTVSGSIQFF